MAAAALQSASGACQGCTELTAVESSGCHGSPLPVSGLCKSSAIEYRFSVLRLAHLSRHFLSVWRRIYQLKKGGRPLGH